MNSVLKEYPTQISRPHLDLKKKKKCGKINIAETWRMKDISPHKI